jgi:hypothetical protein
MGNGVYGMRVVELPEWENGEEGGWLLGGAQRCDAEMQERNGTGRDGTALGHSTCTAMLRSRGLSGGTRVLCVH